jgi:hypothetical protein
MQRLVENWRRYLQEASEDEIGHLDDVLDVAIEDYPFGNIFGESYRMISPISVSVEADGEMGEITQMLLKQGWSIDWEQKGFTCSKTITKTWTGKDGKPNSREVIEKMKLTTLILKMIESVNLLKFSKKMDQIDNEENKTNKKKLILKFNDVYKKWFGDTLLLVRIDSDYPFQDVIKNPWQEAQHFIAVGQMFMTSRQSMKKSHDKLQRFIDWLEVNTADIAANLESYRTKKYYMILSRHPIDVFRMSDHEKIQSCHAPPSSGYKNNMERFDEYNICALSEAHANGMIAYLVLEDEFKRAGIEPTQEEIDKYEDNEIFVDKQRGVEGLNPTSRTRVKNMSYRNEDVLLNFAVPHAKVYGDKVPGFVDHLYSVISPAQEEEVKRLLELEGDILDYGKFTKYGGTYEDTDYEADMNILAFVNGFSEKNITGTGFVNHDDDLEQALKDSFGDPKDAMRLRLDEIEEEYNMNDITLPLRIYPDFFIDDHGDFNYDITMRIRMSCFLNINKKPGLTDGELDFHVEDALHELAEIYEIPPPNNVGVGQQSRFPGYNYELVLEWDLPQSAHKLVDVEGSLDIDEIEDMLDTAYYQGYPAPNLVNKFSPSDKIEDSIPAYIEKFLEKYNYSVSTNYAIEEFHMYIEGNRDVMWESEVKDYDEDQFFGEVPFALNVVSDGLIDIYPSAHFMAQAGYETLNVEEDLEFNPNLPELALKVLKFEIKDYYRPIQVDVEFTNEFTAVDLKGEDGVSVKISFSIDADASERELQKLVSIKDDDYTEVVSAISKKAAVRMKQMKEKYRKTKEKEIERQRQQQIKEMKKKNKIKVKFRR